MELKIKQHENITVYSVIMHAQQLELQKSLPVDINLLLN